MNENSKFCSLKIFVTAALAVLLYDVPGTFHAIFYPLRFLLAFHDPLHPEFTDDLHEWFFRSGALPARSPPVTYLRRISLAFDDLRRPSTALHRLPGLDHLVWIFGMLCAFTFPWFDRQLQVRCNLRLISP